MALAALSADTKSASDERIEMFSTKANRAGHVFLAGDPVTVFGKHACVVASVGSSGKRVSVTGDYTGFTHVDNVTPSASMVALAALDFDPEYAVECGEWS